MVNPISLEQAKCLKANVEAVPIDELMDNGKPRTAANAQRPMNARKWRAKVGPFDAKKVGIIRLVRIGRRLYVADGQHRLAELAAHGFRYVDCEIVNDTPEGAFLASNTGLGVTWRDKWRVLLSEGKSPVKEINDLMEARGYTVSHHSNAAPRAFTCYESLIRAHEAGVLPRSLTVFDRIGGELTEKWMLDGLNVFFRNHPDADAGRLGDKVREIGIARFAAIAQQYRGLSGSAGIGRGAAVYRSLVDAYNHHLRTAKITAAL